MRAISSSQVGSAARAQIAVSGLSAKPGATGTLGFLTWFRLMFSSSASKWINGRREVVGSLGNVGRQPACSTTYNVLAIPRGAAAKIGAFEPTDQHEPSARLGAVAGAGRRREQHRQRRQDRPKHKSSL
jgi:hypothetical protein